MRAVGLVCALCLLDGWFCLCLAGNFLCSWSLQGHLQREYTMAEYSQKEYTPPLESMGCQSYITDLRIAGLSGVLQECFEKYPCLVAEAQRRNRRGLSGPAGCKHADVPFSPILRLWEINPNTIKLITLKPRSIRTWGRGQSIYQNALKCFQPPAFHTMVLERCLQVLPQLQNLDSP